MGYLTEKWWLCPNEPRCPHAQGFHDTDEVDDPLPRCCVEGCLCGAKPERVSVEEVERQRAAGWPGFHPEDFCHRCGRRNVVWGSPDWTVLIGHEGGILCLCCFAALDPGALWTLARSRTMAGTAGPTPSHGPEQPEA